MATAAGWGKWKSCQPREAAAEFAGAVWRPAKLGLLGRPEKKLQFRDPRQSTMSDGRGKLTHNTLEEQYFSGWQSITCGCPVSE